LLQKLFEDLGGIAVIESAPLQEGRNMSMLLAPSKEVDKVETPAVVDAESPAAEAPKAEAAAPEAPEATPEPEVPADDAPAAEAASETDADADAPADVEAPADAPAADA
jgi:translation initiation factor IF-3